MESLFSINVSIPIIQLFMLIVSCTLALLLGKQQFALLINYLFVFYWGFSVNFENHASLNPDISVWFSSSYIVFGCMLMIASLIGLLKRTWHVEILNIGLDLTYNPVSLYIREIKSCSLLFSIRFWYSSRERESVVNIKLNNLLCREYAKKSTLSFMRIISIS